nr:DeoR-like helix-turn-helix domain [uncultured bacterium]
MNDHALYCSLYLFKGVIVLDYAAFPQQRQALICQILQEDGRVVCADLAQRLQVSEHTIRRDLHELSKDGYCKKVYGGAVMTLPESMEYNERKEKNRATKSRIAQKCAQLVKPGGCIFIDTGTTNLAMAEALPGELALTVVTNSPEIAAVLLKKPLSNDSLSTGNRPSPSVVSLRPRDTRTNS